MDITELHQWCDKRGQEYPLWMLQNPLSETDFTRLKNHYWEYREYQLNLARS